MEAALDAVLGIAEGPRSFAESFRDFFVPRKRPVNVDQANAQILSDILVCGSGLFVAGSVTVMMYKLGVFHAVLPASIMQRVDPEAQKLADLTEPPKGARPPGFDKAKGYMLRTYIKTAIGFGVCFSGVLAFFRLPHAPLAIVAAAGLVSGASLVLVDRQSIRPEARSAIFALSLFTGGYTMGPIGWIWYDSTSFIAVALAATATGFSMATILTRGKLAYFVSCQALSTSIALLGTRALIRADATLSYDRLSDVNTLLFFQAMGNLFIAYAHSWQTISYYQEGKAATVEHTSAHRVSALFRCNDSLYDAFAIVAGANYCLFFIFRKLVTFVIRVALAQLESKEKQGKRKFVNKDAEKFIESNAKALVKEVDNADRISHVVGSLLFFVIYLRFATYLQKGNTTHKIEKIRGFFRALNPMPMVG